jgi:hypothetical protein
MIKRLTTVFLAGVILMSCAGTYKPIAAHRMSFDTKTEQNLSYGYRYHVLHESGNKKYEKKETKHGVKLIAIQIQNNTDREIVPREEVRFYIGDKSIFPMEPAQMQQQLKQLSGLYMLWSLLWLNITNCDSDGDCSFIPIPLGLFIGIGNMTTASNANKKLLAELQASNILDKKIAPGETAVGLIGIAAEEVQPIRIELIHE